MLLLLYAAFWAAGVAVAVETTGSDRAIAIAAFAAANMLIAVAYGSMNGRRG